MTDHELYIACRRAVVADLVNPKRFNGKLDKLYDECQQKNPRIYEVALDDAEQHYYSVLNSNGFIIQRIDFMSIGELESSLRGRGNGHIVEHVYRVIRTKPGWILVEVEGDSMDGAPGHIYHGDFVVAEQTTKAPEGAIVVVVVDGEVLVKRLRYGGLWDNSRGYYLESDNRNYPTMFVDWTDNISILGVVQFTIRAVR